MIAHSTEISVSARYAELPGLMAELARHAGLLALPEDDIRRLQLVLEELFTNTIRHGFAAENDTPIQVALARQEHGVTLCYRDQGPPFDPSRQAAPAALETMVGGLGLSLIRGLSKAIRYQRCGQLNITELDF
jgi:serine/threonine-protein kinase RsbW